MALIGALAGLVIAAAAFLTAAGDLFVLAWVVDNGYGQLLLPAAVFAVGAWFLWVSTSERERRRRLPSTENTH